MVSESEATLEEEMEVLEEEDSEEPSVMDEEGRVSGELQQVERDSQRAAALPPRRKYTRETMMGAGALVAFALILTIFLLSGEESQQKTSPTSSVEIQKPAEALPASGKATFQSAQPPSPNPVPEEQTEASISTAPQVKGPAVTSLDLHLRDQGQQGNKTADLSASTSDVEPAATPGSETPVEAPKAEESPSQRLQPGIPSGPFFSINVASFRDLANAQQLGERWRRQGYQDIFITKKMVPGKGTFHRVSVGRFATKTEAMEFAKKIREEKRISAFVVKLMSD
jgi:cell division septation protein DedD